MCKKHEYYEYFNNRFVHNCNGFDLHHGINSSYFEYRIWLKKHYEDIYWEIVNTFEVDDESEDYKIKLEERQYPWWKDFENNLGK